EYRPAGEGDVARGERADAAVAWRDVTTAVAEDGTEDGTGADEGAGAVHDRCGRRRSGSAGGVRGLKSTGVDRRVAGVSVDAGQVQRAGTVLDDATRAAGDTADGQRVAAGDADRTVGVE